MSPTRLTNLRRAWTSLLVLVDTLRVVLTVPPEPSPDQPDDRPRHPREEDS